MKSMMDMNESHWTTPCPKVDCRKKACKCGLSYTFVPPSVEKEYAPVKGLFCNAIVEYESTGAVYIFSSEGIPVLVKEGNAS